MEVAVTPPAEDMLLILNSDRLIRGPMAVVAIVEKIV